MYKPGHLPHPDREVDPSRVHIQVITWPLYLTTAPNKSLNLVLLVYQYRISRYLQACRFSKIVNTNQ